MPWQNFPISFSAVVAAKVFDIFVYLWHLPGEGRQGTNPAFPFHTSDVSCCFRSVQLLLMWQDKSACFTLLPKKLSPSSELWCRLWRLGWLLGMFLGVFFFKLGQVRGGDFQEERAHCRRWNVLTPWVGRQPWTFSWAANSISGGWITFHFLWLIENWFNKVATSVNGPVCFLTVFTERLWGENKKKRKNRTVACPDSHPSPATSFRRTLFRNLSV